MKTTGRRAGQQEAPQGTTVCRHTRAIVFPQTCCFRRRTYQWLGSGRGVGGVRRKVLLRAATELKRKQHGHTGSPITQTLIPDPLLTNSQLCNLEQAP